MASGEEMPEDDALISPPPPGSVPNLVDPPSTGYQLVVTTCVFDVIASVFLILRLYTRAHLVKYIGWDDYLISFAFITCLVSSTIAAVCTRHGVGTDVWNVKYEDIARYQELQLYILAFYAATMMLTKLSLLLLYRRLFSSTTKWFTISWCTTLVITVGYSIPLFIGSLAWHETTISAQRRYTTFFTTHGALNILTDIAIMALPIPMIWQSNLHIRQKIIVSLIFVLGAFSCIVCIARLSVTPYTELFKDSASHLNPTRMNLTALVLLVMEMTTAIICACAGTLRPLLQQYFSILLSSNRPNNTIPSFMGPQGIQTYGSEGSQQPRRSKPNYVSVDEEADAIDLKTYNEV